MKKVNKEDQKYFINYISDYIETKTDIYTTTPIISIIFSYGLREGLAPSNSFKKSNIKFQTFYRNKLPIAFNPEDYGKILTNKGNLFIIALSNRVTIQLNQITKNNTKINLVKYFKNNNLLYEWKDTQTNLEIPNTFIREIRKSVYHFENGELNLVTLIKKTKPIERTISDKNLLNKFISMDLETFKDDNNKLTPYLLSWCYADGNISKSYFITDYKDFKSLLIQVFIDLKEYNNYSVYFHNFAKFDSYFLLKYLIELGNVDPIIHKDKLISLNFMNQENNLKLNFKDSYLLLPSSLKNLSKSFNIDSPKGTFPIHFNDIEYIGDVPLYNYFNTKSVTLDQYNEYKNNYNRQSQEWNFRTEAIKYCELDCISLYQILIKFNNLIFDKFKLNIHKYPTTPSLAFKIFRNRFLPKDKIHMLTGDIESDIRTSYTGGAVGMYIPINEPNEKVLFQQLLDKYKILLSLL